MGSKVMATIPEVHPKLGDVRWNKHGCKEVWHACIDCYKERWVQMVSGEPINIRCSSCAHRISSTGRHLSESTKNKIAKAITKHGASHTRLYGVWRGILTRCYNERATNYARYGGKNISVCETWRKSFIAFRDWAIQSGYKEGLRLSIDRCDNALGYTPSNCRWIPLSVNSWKDKSYRAVTQYSLNGELAGYYYSISHASRATGISASNIGSSCRSDRKHIHAGGFVWRYAS